MVVADKGRHMLLAAAVAVIQVVVVGEMLIRVVAMAEDAFRMSDGLAPVAPMIPNSETLKTTKAIVINPAAPTP